MSESHRENVELLQTYVGWNRSVELVMPLEGSCHPGLMSRVENDQETARDDPFEGFASDSSHAMFEREKVGQPEYKRRRDKVHP